MSRRLNVGAVDVRGSWTPLSPTSQEGAKATRWTASSAGTLRPLVLISSLRPGGAERIVVTLMCRLAQRGFRAALCTLNTLYDDAQLAEEVQKAGVTRYDLRARRLSDPRVVARYLRLLAHARVNLVHAHGQDAWILAGMVRRFTDVPLAFTRHVLDEPADTWRQALRRRSALAASRQADALVAPSYATADSLGRLAGFCPSRVHVIPNGINLERFERPAIVMARDETRRALGFEAHERIVILPAVLRPGKGHDVLLEALPIIQTRVPHVRVVFAGDGERDAELRLRARSYGPEVVFLGHRNDLPELLAACDLVVLPSFSEALPTVLIEAAAAGRPVVATRVGGTPDVVEHGVTGLLVPPGDPRALADAILSLLSDPAKAEAFGRAARILVHHRFSLDGHVDRTLELWSRIIANRRGHS
jgi:glycosyltransferase involved in cell wall biosynthesis